MPSDILLREERIRVVGGDGQERVDGTERGDLEIAAGENDRPSIRLNADWANLVLGGGDGKSPEGDLKIRDSNDRNRIVATAENNNDRSDDTRVWVDGQNARMEVGSGDANGSIALGDGEDRPAVEIAASADDLTENETRDGSAIRSRVAIDGQDPGIEIRDTPRGPGDRGARTGVGAGAISLHGGLRRGGRETVLTGDGIEVSRWGAGDGEFQAKIAGGEATLGGDGDGGILKLRGDDGTTAGELTGGNLSLGMSGGGAYIHMRPEYDYQAQQEEVGVFDGVEYLIHTTDESKTLRFLAAKEGRGGGPLLELDANEETVRVRVDGELKSVQELFGD